MDKSLSKTNNKVMKKETEIDSAMSNHDNDLCSSLMIAAICIGVLMLILIYDLTVEKSKNKMAKRDLVRDPLMNFLRGVFSKLDDSKVSIDT